MSFYDYYNLQPVLGLPDLALIPKPCHPAAKAWLEVWDRLEAADDAAEEAKAAVAAAKTRDWNLAREAARNDKPMPPEHECEDPARVALRDAERRRDHIAGDAREAGAKLLDQLREHRAELAELTRPTVAAALDEYAATTARARQIIKDASTKLSAATATLPLIKQLDDRDSGVHPVSVDVPPDTLDQAPKNIERVRAWMALLDDYSPDTAVMVVGANGTRTKVRAELAYSMIRSEMVDLADPGDMAKLLAVVGTTAEPIPDKKRYHTVSPALK